jgi:hypothetical protein
VLLCLYSPFLLNSNDFNGHVVVRYVTGVVRVYFTDVVTVRNFKLMIDGSYG